jgi:ElaB/YqjD/DUF883 family membrane-anchored ribosome-binding protein
MALNYAVEKVNYAEDQSFAHLILYVHVTHKTAQAGSVLGAALGCLIGLVRREPFVAIKTGANLGLLSGLALGPAMTWGKMRTAQHEIEWQDRAWRLQRNQTQNIMDVGSEVGLAAALLVGGSPYTGLGVGIGSIAGLATKKFLM